MSVKAVFYTQSVSQADSHIAVPRVRRIVYSTCSIHAIENERVVCEALRSDEAGRRNFKLAPPEEVLPSWHRRGLPDELESPGENNKPTPFYCPTLGSPESASSLVRCSPNEDATNGFFVSCFVSTDAAQATHSGDNFMTKKRKRDGESSSKKRRKLDQR